MGSATPAIDAGARERLGRRFGAAVGAWLDELPGVLTALAEGWELVLGGPIPRGSVSVVFRCRTADGRSAVLKASPDRARLAYEAAALRSWHTAHTPAVIALDEQVGALLLEAIEPGTPLAVSAAYPTVESVAGLLGSLHRSGDPDPSYPPVAERVRRLFESSVKLYEWYPALHTVVPPDLYARGHGLASWCDVPVVRLHGDLTPGNVLDGGPERGLVAIDPAPCLGDGAFDAVDLVMWQADDLQTIETRAEQLATAGGLDAGRLLAWCTAFAGMSALELASQGSGRPAAVDALVRLASQAPST